MPRLQTSLVSETLEPPALRIIFEVLDPDLGCLVLETHFPRTCLKNDVFFSGLGAARRSQADQADRADQAEMVHGRQLGP